MNKKVLIILIINILLFNSGCGCKKKDQDKTTSKEEVKNIYSPKKVDNYLISSELSTSPDNHYVLTVKLCNSGNKSMVDNLITKVVIGGIKYSYNIEFKKEVEQNNCETSIIDLTDDTSIKIDSIEYAFEKERKKEKRNK